MMPNLFRRRTTEPPAPTTTTHRDVQDLRVAACPYCGIELKKLPASATKCPGCGERMYIRKDNRANTRSVVTEEQAYRIDDSNNALAEGTINEYETRVRETTDMLRIRFQREPDYRDVRWSLLSQDLLTFQARGDLGLYRNTKYDMMQQLNQGGPRTLRQALDIALEVFYLDQCGPNNLGGSRSAPEIGARQWGPAPKAVKGSLTEWIGDYCQRLGITAEDAAREYEASAAKSEESLRMPRSWSEIWPKCL